ncbi:cytochrome b [Agrobacterium vitis]|uniref:cytochrome b n=1 Tax=Agrobacterium vitis TaxID=373 RepID=UPI0015739472|nr:cytochrome b/b6 domain-containing protein [Agrobacterium vitis]NSY14862.1 cytochrome B [Agrobacterium vitis]NSY24619.1 cytochrome B [Agrobacterium vitis]WEO75247.1 cytochrome b/b6 domain-containing protein [Agrobacterium vitis]
MKAKRNESSHGGIAVALHWIIAVGIVTLLVLGFAAGRAVSESQQADILRVHITLGVSVLLLTLFRAIWWSLNRRPGRLSGQPLWQHHVAQVTHALLYGVPVIAAASGIGLLIFSGAGPIIFLHAPGPLPQFEDFPPMAVHAIAAFTLIGLIVLHVVAALYHQVLRRDRLLARMGIGRGQIFSIDGE